MARIAAAGRLAFGQVDFFESGNRKLGVVWSDLTMSLFVDGQILAWGFIDGAFVADSSIGAGSVCFNEMSGAAGFYLVRFFPDRTGFWRIVLKHPDFGEVICEFDAFPSMLQSSGMLTSVMP